MIIPTETQFIPESELDDSVKDYYDMLDKMYL